MQGNATLKKQAWQLTSSQSRSIEVSRAFLTGVAVGVEAPDAMGVVMVVNSGSVFDGRNGNGIR